LTYQIDSLLFKIKKLPSLIKETKASAFAVPLLLLNLRLTTPRITVIAVTSYCLIQKSFSWVRFTVHAVPVLTNPGSLGLACSATLPILEFILLDNSISEHSEKSIYKMSFNKHAINKKWIENQLLTEFSIHSSKHEKRCANDN